MKFTAHLPDTNKLSLRGDQQTDRTASLCPKETRWNLTCWWKAKENMFWPRRMWDWEPDLMSHRVTCSPSQPTVQTQTYMIARIYSCARLLQTWIWRYNSENYSLDIVARFSTICLSVWGVLGCKRDTILYWKDGIQRSCLPSLRLRTGRHAQYICVLSLNTHSSNSCIL